MTQTLQNGRSRNILLTMIQSEAHRRQVAAIFEVGQADINHLGAVKPQLFQTFAVLPERMNWRTFTPKVLPAQK